MQSIHKYACLSRYDFDYVLIYHGINDLWANHIPAAQFASDYSHMDRWHSRNIVLDNCLIARRVYNWIHRGRISRVPTALTHDLANGAASAVFERNIESLIQSIRADGAVPILMTFAWCIPSTYSFHAFNNRRAGYNNPTDYNRCVVEMWGEVDYVKEGLKKHNLAIRGLAEKHDVLLIDQRSLLGDRPYWFGDVCHLSEEGTERFIEHIVAFCQEHDLLRCDTVG